MNGWVSIVTFNYHRLLLLDIVTDVTAARENTFLDDERNIVFSDRSGDTDFRYFKAVVEILINLTEVFALRIAEASDICCFLGKTPHSGPDR
jgi:hypothetical protein